MFICCTQKLHHSAKCNRNIIAHWRMRSSNKSNKHSTYNNVSHSITNDLLLNKLKINGMKNRTRKVTLKVENDSCVPTYEKYIYIVK